VLLEIKNRVKAEPRKAVIIQTVVDKGKTYRG